MQGVLTGKTIVFPPMKDGLFSIQRVDLRKEQIRLGVLEKTTLARQNPLYIHHFLDVLNRVAVLNGVGGLITEEGLGYNVMSAELRARFEAAGNPRVGEVDADMTTEQLDAQLKRMASAKAALNLDNLEKAKLNSDAGIFVDAVVRPMIDAKAINHIVSAWTNKNDGDHKAHLDQLIAEAKSFMKNAQTIWEAIDELWEEIPICHDIHSLVHAMVQAEAIGKMNTELLTRQANGIEVHLDVNHPKRTDQYLIERLHRRIGMGAQMDLYRKYIYLKRTSLDLAAVCKGVRSKLKNVIAPDQPKASNGLRVHSATIAEEEPNGEKHPSYDDGYRAGAAAASASMAAVQEQGFEHYEDNHDLDWYEQCEESDQTNQGVVSASVNVGSVTYQGNNSVHEDKRARFNDQPCRFYATGQCSEGDMCIYAHDHRLLQRPVAAGGSSLRNAPPLGNSITVQMSPADLQMFQAHQRTTVQRQQQARSVQQIGQSGPMGPTGAYGRPPQPAGPRPFQPTGTNQGRGRGQFRGGAYLGGRGRG